MAEYNPTRTHIRTKFPMHEYTPPGHRERWQIARDLRLVHFRLLLNRMKLGSFQDDQEKEEHENLREKLAKQLSSLERELSMNNKKRRTVYDYFPRRVAHDDHAQPLLQS
ncbi:hypothetical protein PQX77_016754 [Marasmius sp. AFHP31]|nr:hypothetical protein PQX77_016754 [Marasmius sp. AFHP31]